VTPLEVLECRHFFLFLLKDRLPLKEIPIFQKGVTFVKVGEDVTKKTQVFREVREVRGGPRHPSDEIRPDWPPEIGKK
jgi:hypothetical protein